MYIDDRRLHGGHWTGKMTVVVCAGKTQQQGSGESFGGRKRGRCGTDDGDDGVSRKKRNIGWMFGGGDGTVLSGLTASVVSLVSGAFTSLWPRPRKSKNTCDDASVSDIDDIDDMHYQNPSCEHAVQDCGPGEGGHQQNRPDGNEASKVDVSQYDAEDDHAKQSSEDTETEYQRILSMSTIERPGPATVELSVAKPVTPVSRLELRQRLLDTITSSHRSSKPRMLGSVKGDLTRSLCPRTRIGTSDYINNSRGARMLDLLPKKTGKEQARVITRLSVVDNNNNNNDIRSNEFLDTIADLDAIDHEEDDGIGRDATQEVSLMDMACPQGDCSDINDAQDMHGEVGQLFSENNPEFYDDQRTGKCEEVSRAMDIVGNIVADLDTADAGNEGSAGTSRMLLFGDEFEDQQPSISLSLDGLTRQDEIWGKPAEDGFSGFTAVTPSMEMTFADEASHLSPVSFLLPSSVGGPCMAIDNHNADLSPEDCSVHEDKTSRGVEQRAASPHPDVVTGAEAACHHHHVETEEPISSIAARQGSLKSAKALLKKRLTRKQAEDDALFTRLREVILNRHLANCYQQGHAWARLDARGVELDSSIDHGLVVNEVLAFFRREKGEDLLNKYLAQIDEEWGHISSVRQKYSPDVQKEHSYTPPRSILKRPLPGDKRAQQSQTLRWAEEDTQHRYLAIEMEMDEHHSMRPPSSTRGLRMLLASASPNVVLPSPKSTNVDQEIEPYTRKISATTRSRSRTKGAPGRASQGQRLFQALQQASSCTEQQLHAPRTLSMIFDKIDEENECLSNTSNSLTTSDNTTSSNSSGRGGLPVGGRWSAEEVACLIQGFQECTREDVTRKNLWKNILNRYKGKGISECRTSIDLKDKWKNLRRTAIKKVNARYVKLDTATLEWLRSDDAKPHGQRASVQ